MPDLPDPDVTRTAPPPRPDTVTADPDATRTHPGGPAASGELVVPGYEVLEVIGRGGMGVVYKARQVAVNRVVALKMTHAGMDTSPTAAARFQIEAEAVAALQHPGIVQLFEFGQSDHVRFLALEYVPGGTLAGRMAERPFTPRQAAELVAALADAVHAAHQKGVIHRDLKPHNVLMTEAGSPKITDFGLARIGRSELTHAGAIMGTPSYMSPEQATGDVTRIGTPADVWALGAILYELLTGRPPFPRDSVTATLHAVIHDTPEPPRALNRKVPRDLETVCRKCLSKDPADRYRTADALAADLRAFLGGFPVAARPVGFVRRTWKWVKRNPIRSAIGAALLAGGVTLGALVPRYSPTADDTPPPGVRVERDEEAEETFYTAGQSGTVYKYTGAALEFWVEVARPGQPTQVLRTEPWEGGAEEAVREARGPGTVGRWVWTRGERDKNGNELWKAGLRRMWPDPDSPLAPTAATVLNAFARGQVSIRGAKGHTYHGQRTIAFGKHPGGPNGSTWELGVPGYRNPLPEDRAVCLHDRDGGWGSDIPGDRPKTKEYTIRVMCQVLTPELATELKAERDARRKAEGK